MDAESQHNAVAEIVAAQLKTELAAYERKFSCQEEEIAKLQKQLAETRVKLNNQEIENESLRRLSDRLNTDNEHLLQKFDSVSKAALILQDNENTLHEKIKILDEENKHLRENVVESNLTRDNVIEKLKDVSIETKQLIDSCEKATEDGKLLIMKNAELENELRRLKSYNECLEREKAELKIEIHNADAEISSLRQALSVGSESTCQVSNVIENRVSSILNSVGDIESDAMVVVSQKKLLQTQIEELQSEIRLLREQHAAKDDIITKQNEDFIKIKSTVEEYHKEIFRLDSELKNCQKRVSVLKANFATVNNENLDIEEYARLRTICATFGSVENVENLLSKLQVLRDMELFFEQKLSTRVEADSNEVVVDSRQNTVVKIKNFLEKVLITIEKLNEKLLRLKTEYENKLRTKNVEISTLKEVLSNATLYNKILEQALQQCKENLQLDKNIENKTDELLSVNETLLQGFEELRQMYEDSERCNNFLFAKCKQLENSYRILKIELSKCTASDERLETLCCRIDEFFDEVNSNEYKQRVPTFDPQQILNRCEKELVSKDHLKNTVENMSQEVKRLASKVEHEMAEKIHEIKTLKDEMDGVRADNCDLVNKIKNCNREIVSLSTSNYDLNEKLENLSKIEDDYEIVKQELEALKNGIVAVTATDRSMSNDPKIGHLTELHSLIRTLKNDQMSLKESFCSWTAQIGDDMHSLRSQGYPSVVNEETVCRLNNLKRCCDDLRSQMEHLKKADINSIFDEMIVSMKKDVHEKLQRMSEQDKNLLQSQLVRIHSTVNDAKEFNKVFRRLIEELNKELVSFLPHLSGEIQNAFTSVYESMKTSFASSHEEMIKEMQDMNLELKNRGETISTLNQLVNDLEKEKNELKNQLECRLEEMKEKENSFCAVKNELDELKTSSANEQNTKIERVDSLVKELDQMKEQLRKKDDIIVSMEMEISKQKDGDTSSMGTISRTEEVSRLNDVEDSFEERYTKLRYIAVKMKKNIAELNAQLKNESNERTILQNKLAVVMEQAKTSQALQEECDRLADQVDIDQREIKELKKIILETDKRCIELKQRCDEQTNIVESSKEQLNSSKTALEIKEKEQKELNSRLDLLTKEKSAVEIVRKEKEKEVHSLKQKFKEIEESRTKLSSELEAARREARKQGVLTLEMRDYEKTITDLNVELKEKRELINDLDEKLTMCNRTNDSLVERIRQFEEQVEAFVLNNKLADEQIIDLNKTVANYECKFKDQEQRLKQMDQQLEMEKNKNEDLTLQLATSVSEIKTLNEIMRAKEKELNEQIKSIRLKFISAEEKLKKKENEYEKIKEDFDAYKIRAHSALQKFKSENGANNNEVNLRSEIESLGRTVKELRKRLENAVTLGEKQNTEIDALKTAKEQLISRVKELTDTVKDKNNEADAIRAEFKSHKLNSETLISCYKAEIEKLKMTVEELNREKVGAKNQLSEDNCQNITEAKSKVFENGFADTFDRASNLSNDLQDNEAESIKETERYRRSSRNSLIPLDKLLENDINDRFDCNETELLELKKSLEQRVSHLTDLLNESEKNAARNEQQVTFLKNEIRRLQRIVEREPHLQNAEYIKNVIFKFITLPIGDEKYRLITVLETILKLTPNEKETLCGIAKGNRDNTGWTSFLGWS